MDLTAEVASNHRPVRARLVEQELVPLARPSPSHLQQMLGDLSALRMVKKGQESPTWR